MAHVSGWLEDRGLTMGQLTTVRVEDLVFRRASGHAHRLAPRGIRPLLVYLRGLGAAPAAAAPALTASDRLLVEFEAYLGFLAVTGIRVGEAIALDRDDVDLRERQLTIREAKRGTRQLPLHASTVQALDAYAHRRDRLCPTPKAPSFSSPPRAPG